MEEEIVVGMDDLVKKRQRKFRRRSIHHRRWQRFTLQTDIMENLKRIYEHSKRISKLVLRQEGGTGWQRSTAKRFC